jgi:hypothetical protein
MECPICHVDNDYRKVTVDPNEDALEIGFTCQGCGIEQFVIVDPKDFERVD